ncbi:Adenylosuccinate lyase [Elusimicrobium minutum Pei191]|uniref:Adenylosuccinate lyase n=1 Tax=Elusimicrobium minutum (strain Pei191) TaxID=445932 RepID=B2KEG4_ELUMP|nr:adenylosuccinate lyase [Elusimicrobium minutum]ACC98910.1 Adenylosuccinate lyase [Elusimicrobium minutum Pei191]
MSKSHISPLDGRYKSKLSALSHYMGEAALSGQRVNVEIEYFKALAGLGLKNFPKLKESEVKILNSILPLSEADLVTIKDIEFRGYRQIKATNHDVKAIEYFLKLRLGASSLKNRLEWIHFALTSEDINSISYALMLRDGVENVLLPELKKIHKELTDLSKKYASTIILARTHGQAAVPTTFGKEFKVFEYRLRRQIKQLEKQQISCKLGGAVGNFNAHFAAFDKVNWHSFAKKFISGFNKGRGVKIFLNEVSTQIDSHDTYAELFDNVKRANTILLDFCQDMWRYISDDYIKQRPVEGEVGSSTMPQKVNPIDFENAEGNIGLANALFGYFSSKLPVSRLQRDLSDSTVSRNFAVAFGYSVVAYSAILKGLGKISVNTQKCAQALHEHPEVLAEGVQTILRACGIQNPYEKLKALTRGKKIDNEVLRRFIEDLDVSKEVKDKLKKLSLEQYTGIAAKLAKGLK